MVANMGAFITLLLVAGGIWLLVRGLQAKGGGSAPPALKRVPAANHNLAPSEGLRSGKPFTLEGRSYRLSGNGRVSVVGESYRRKELARVVKGYHVTQAGDWDNALRRDALLIPEPTNKYDGDAVRVLLEVEDDWAHVGYLSADTAAEYVGLCNNLIARGRVPLVEGRVVRSANGHAVYLHLADPDSCLFANEEPDGDVLAPQRQCAVTRESEHQDVLGSLPLGLYWATLHPSTVTAGKYAGDFTIEVQIDGQRVGELTAAQGKRYRSVLQAGGVVGCEADVFSGTSCNEVMLMLPRVD
jgi:hypothetical protein